MVNGVIPQCCNILFSADEEPVVMEEDSKGLNPGEVTSFQGRCRVVFAYEMCVDVEVGVGHQAKVFVFLAMEVEGDSIATDEARVLAHRTRSIAF